MSQRLLSRDPGVPLVESRTKAGESTRLSPAEGLHSHHVTETAAEYAYDPAGSKSIRLALVRSSMNTPLKHSRGSSSRGPGS